jgi:hypothetical protein
MALTGVNIYYDGIGINQDVEEKVQRIIDTIKAISPSSDVSMRFLKSGGIYEGLLWSKAGELPISVYMRGISMAQVLENIYKRVKKDCVRALKSTRGRPLGRQKQRQVELEMAG